MNKNTIILLRAYNSETSRHEETGETLTTYQLARSMTELNFASLLDEYLNLGGKGFREGKQVGLQLRDTHRTLQRLVICFALGIVSGLAEQQYTDPRNETAIQTARRIVELISQGELPFGPYI